MLHRLASLFVGVLASVGVTLRGLEAVPATPMSKHWPRETTTLRAIILMSVALAAMLVGVLMANDNLVLANLVAIKYR